MSPFHSPLHVTEVLPQRSYKKSLKNAGLAVDSSSNNTATASASSHGHHHHHHHQHQSEESAQKKKKKSSKEKRLTEELAPAASDSRVKSKKSKSSKEKSTNASATSPPVDGASEVNLLGTPEKVKVKKAHKEKRTVKQPDEKATAAAPAAASHQNTSSGSKSKHKKSKTPKQPPSDYEEAIGISTPSKEAMQALY